MRRQGLQLPLLCMRQASAPQSLRLSLCYVTEYSSKHPLPYYYHYTNNLKYIRGNQKKDLFY